VVENTPPGGLQRYPDMEEDGNAVSVSDKFILFYFGARQPAERVLIFPELKKYKLEIIDTWEMTITPIEGFFSGKVLVKLPGKPYIAVRAILVQ
jgi:hypothetical protein